MNRKGRLVRQRLLRLLALGMCNAVVVAAGLGIRAFISEPFVEHAGTVLYATLMYLMVTMLAARMGPFLVARNALAVCWLVEFGQLTGVPARLAAHSTLSRLVLGVAFQPLDLLWYCVGVAAAGCLHWMIRRWRARRTGGTATRSETADPPNGASEAVHHDTGPRVLDRLRRSR